MNNNTKLRIRISESEFRSVIKEMLAESKGDTFAMNATKKMMKSKGTKSAGKAPSTDSTSTESKPAAPKKAAAPKAETAPKAEKAEESGKIEEKKAAVAKNPAQILKALKAWLDKHMPDEEEEQEGEKEEKKEEAPKKEEGAEEGE